MRMLFFICLLMAMPVSAVAAEYPVGDLAITYDPAHWTFEQTSKGDPLRAQPATFEAKCTPCRGDGSVGISVADVAREESEAVLDPAWARNTEHSALTVGELTIAVTTIESPCRNYVPPSIVARTSYRGHTYTFRSGAAMGCRGSFGVASGRFEELLRGLHPR
jgi:hypothetical protein